MACRDVQQSAIREVRDQLFLDRADDIRLNVVTSNLGLNRPTVGTDDDEWRALAKEVALQFKQVRNIFYRLLEICVGPQKTRVAYAPEDAVVGSTTVTVDNPEALVQVGTLVFDPGMVSEEEVNFCYRDMVTGKVYLSTPLLGNHDAVDAASNYLASAHPAASATLTLYDTSEFPLVGEYPVIIDEGTEDEEIVVVASNDGINTLSLVSQTEKAHLGPKSKGFIRRELLNNVDADRDFLQFDEDATRVFPKTGFVRIDFGGANEEVIEYKDNDAANAVLWLKRPLQLSHTAGDSVEYISPGALVRTAPIIQRGIAWSVHETEPRKVKICIPEEVLVNRLVDASFLHDVSPPTASTALTANANIGDTTLTVTSTASFRPTTGALLIAGTELVQYASIIDATTFKLTEPLVNSFVITDTVDSVSEAYASTDLEEGNLRQADGSVDLTEAQWSGPYMYDVLQFGVSLTQTTLAEVIPPPALVVFNQSVGRTNLEVNDASLWPTPPFTPFTVRIGNGTGFSEDRVLVDRVLRADGETSLDANANISDTTIDLTDATVMPGSDGTNPAGYHIIIDPGGPNEEILLVDQKTVNAAPGTLSLLSPITINHLVGEVVALIYDTLTFDVLQQPHKAEVIDPTLFYPGHLPAHRVDILHDSIAVASVAGFPDDGTVWLNFGYGRVPVRKKVTFISTSVLEFDDTSVFPTGDFPYQIIVGEGLPAEERALVSANNTGTNQLTVTPALVLPHSDGEYVEFRPGKPITVTYTDTDTGSLDLAPNTIFDVSYSEGESVIYSPGAAIPTEFGTDYPLRLPPSPVACVANMVDLVRAAGIEVILPEDCFKDPE